MTTPRTRTDRNRPRNAHERTEEGVTPKTAAACPVVRSPPNSRWHRMTSRKSAKTPEDTAAGSLGSSEINSPWMATAALTRKALNRRE